MGISMLTLPPWSTSAGLFSKIWTQCHTDGTGQTNTAPTPQISLLSTTTFRRVTRTRIRMMQRTKKSLSQERRSTHMITTTSITEEPDDNRHHNVVIDEAKSFFIERFTRIAPKQLV